MITVRAKLFKPGEDNFGTRWQEVQVHDDGVGVAIFTARRRTHWTKFRVATKDNSRIIQENMIRPDDLFSEVAYGIHVMPDDVVTVNFVLHELAFVVRLNEDLSEEDTVLLQLHRMKERLDRRG